MKQLLTLLLTTLLLLGATMPANAQEQAKTKEQIKAEKQALKEQKKKEKEQIKAEKLALKEKKKKEKEERRAYFKQAIQAMKQQEEDNTTNVTAAEDPVLANGAMDPTGKETTASIVGTWSGKGLYAHAKTISMKISDSKFTITFRSNGTFTATEYVSGVRSQNNVGLKIQLAYTDTWGGTYKRNGNAVDIIITQRPQRKISKYITTGDEFTIKALNAAGNNDEKMRKNDETSFNEASRNTPAKDFYYRIKRHSGNSIVISKEDYLPMLLNRAK